MHKQTPSHYSPISNLRGSYDYNRQNYELPKTPNCKIVVPGITQSNERKNYIKTIENKIEGVESRLKQKQFKPTEPVTTPNKQPMNFKTSFDYHEASRFHINNNIPQQPQPESTEELRDNDLRGSCPNIFRKIDYSNFKSMNPLAKLNQTNQAKEEHAENVDRTQPIMKKDLGKNYFNTDCTNSTNSSDVKKEENKRPQFLNAKKQPKKEQPEAASGSKPLKKPFTSLNQIWEIKQHHKKTKLQQQNKYLSKPLKSNIINGFQMGSVLGKGKFGEVYIGRHVDTGALTALKKITKTKVKEYKMVDQFIKEIFLHSSLDHPNIVKFYGFFEDKNQIYLLIEYLNGGTLFDCLNEVPYLTVKDTVDYLRDVIEAVNYLHEKSIAHRDIKPQNIVISTEGVAKLCDFGWSAIVQTSRKTYCGTFDYAPPEILERKSYDTSVDIWCIGVLTYELLTGRVPFEGEKRNDIMEKIVNVDKMKIDYPPNVPSDAKDFIEWLVQKDPTARPKCHELMKHPFFGNNPPKVKPKK